MNRLQNYLYDTLGVNVAIKQLPEGKLDKLMTRNNRAKLRITQKGLILSFIL